MGGPRIRKRLVLLALVCLPVSYTHLDVYKRQGLYGISAFGAAWGDYPIGTERS